MGESEHYDDNCISSGWKEIRISEMGQVITGKTPSTKRLDFWNGDIPFVTPSDLQGTIIRNVPRSITHAGLKGPTLLPEKSVVISCIGNIGKVGLTGFDCSVTNQQINAIVPSNNYDPWFLLYLFLYHRPLFENNSSVTTIPILNKRNMGRLSLMVPPLPEQKAIARVLRTVQRAKEKTEKVIAAARELKRSLMKHLFTYGPVPFDQTDQVELKETEIGEVPEGWEENAFGDIAGFKNGLNFKANQKGSGILMVDVLNMYRKGDFVETRNLYRVAVDLKDEYRLQKHDILFVRSSLKEEGVGWAALFEGHREPVAFCGFLIRARIEKQDISQKFLVNYFRLPAVRRVLISKSGKVAITNISQGNLKATSVFLPSVQRGTTRDR